MIDRKHSDPPSARPPAHCRAISPSNCPDCLPGRLPRCAGLDWRVSDVLRLLQALASSCKLLQDVGRVSWPGGSVASQRGRIKQQLWPRRVVCDSISRGSRQQRQPWKTRPDKTRQARQDRTRVQASWQSHWSRPIGSARTRPPGPGAESGSWISTAAAPETLFLLSLCYCVTPCHPSVHLSPPSPSSQPIPSAWAPSSLPNHGKCRLLPP